MINDEPDARGLVTIALQTFRDSILPVVPAERRFEALMIANALSIAERELAAEPEPALAAAIGGLIGETGDLETLAPMLCSAVDAGAFDAPERQAELRSALWELTRARLSVSNPRLLDPA
jgi:Domain of unknown function (DUF6285)